MNQRLRFATASARAAVVFAALLALAAGPVRAQNNIDQKAVDRAHDFLKTTKRGRDICSFVHFGAKYQGHTFKETRFVTNSGKRVPGHFALAYDYDWDKDGTSEVVFLCDRRGNIYQVQAPPEESNAIVQKPFFLANGAIKLLGNLLIEAFKDKMSDKEKEEAQKLVDEANAKGMLEMSLKLQQTFGK